ncbi:1,6-anhydro-N-acetylmuramyl-L-alanine amidase AmpD [Aquabacterium sp.]|uniref:1,6-anhydro-N-acetylmuramyl-L-alanine amidase AmpD n=1 Tax=Aquabacterium sp. TaxID=1872578 RepID=UPI00248845CA|nr:1,6-anhydro-N-acetylmuramyl-L-alanine amidase AmpD [Aquabacterium sp.]MDI1261078.1 1,6-anhydro-N-acetylmuramyl-L-alanine amidase AmpD [Aquabacterium sp.]
MAHDPWPQGWCPQARRIDSPNFGPRPPGIPINLALIHSISLPPGIYGGDEIERLFTNQLDWDAHPYFGQIRGAEVSAHFVIRRDGELLQFVSANDRAWHAGPSSWQGRDNCNDHSIGIELEGLEDHPFEWAQYQALADLLQQAVKVYPISQIAGHEHVAPGRKRDPGQAFDWPALHALLGWDQRSFPPGTTSL